MPSTPESSRLEESWCPVSPTGSSDSDNDDDTLGSSHDGSSTDTGRDQEEEESLGGLTADELDGIMARPSSPLSASSLLGGESYIDAESPSTHLGPDASVGELSARTSSVSSSQMPLIYPYADIDNSFSSSTTLSDTTPSASVGRLPPSLVTAVRTSKHRLDAGKTPTKAGSADRVLPISTSSLWSPTMPHHELPDDSGYQPLLSFDHLPSPFTELATEASLGSAQSDKDVQSIADIALERARGAARNIREGWNLRRSVYTLAGILSIALAAAQYSGSLGPALVPSAPQTPAPVVVQTQKPFSIFDYIPVPSLSIPSASPEPMYGAKSFVPDVRLIKHALSLSTKSVALAPAEVKSTDKASKSHSHAHTAKSVGPTAHSLSLRNTDVGLTTLMNVSAMWSRSLRGALPKSGSTRGSTTATQEDCQCSYRDIIVADIKNVWGHALSSHTYADFLHFVRNQLIETVMLELRATANVAIEILSFGRNVTLAASSHAYTALDHLRNYTASGLTALHSYGSTVNTTASTQAAYESARKARSGLESLGAEGTKRSKDAVYQARAGLDHLIAEAKRLYGVPTSTEDNDARQVRQDIHAGSGKRDRFSRQWHRRHTGHGRSVAAPKLRDRHESAKKGPWSSRFYRSLHDTEGQFTLAPESHDWQAFRCAVDGLVQQCADDEQIKVIYLGRHGQAMHNLLADQTGLGMYETQKRFGRPDQFLSPHGRDQAARLGEVLKQAANEGMPLPTKWFVSSLTRTGETSQLQWDWLSQDQTGLPPSGLPAIVVEEWRERLHRDICNQRSTLGQLRAAFPSFTFPPDMPQADDMWLPEKTRGSETNDELAARLKVAMDKTIEQSGESTYISVTTHGQVTKYLDRVLGGPLARLELGQMRVMVLRVTRVK